MDSQSRLALLLLVPCLALNGSLADSNKIVIAHRGASGYLPEHTLEAKALGHASGAEYVEQDVELSKDDVPVVLHDIHIDSVTDVAERFPDRKRGDNRFYAIDFTLAELKSLRVTERFDPKTKQPVFRGRFPLWKSSFYVPTLAEEIELVQGLNTSTGRSVGIYPEIKEPQWHKKEGKDISPIVLDTLARYGYKRKVDNFWIQCFDLAELKRIRGELHYSGNLLWLIDEDDPKWPVLPNPNASLIQIQKEMASVEDVIDGIGPALSHLMFRSEDGQLQTTGLVKYAHSLRMKVHAYTARADDLPPYAASMERLLRLILIDCDADGVFTDFPDQAHMFIQQLKPSQPK
jgi:glycerophosphoryl diester phosphodiesterase